MTCLEMPIAAAVEDCELVSGLHAGRFGTISTGAGRDRIIGVRRERGTILVGVIGRPGVNSVRVVDEVRATVVALEPGATVSVRVEAQDPAA
ncbi:hypothetical protein EV383_3823 [Pseudonocardia sediminis]|uniref:Uncharacterized protein n=1 Tax=Pseudonocardia sediminis TaxID=1397368 RepID=A0A4Q7V0H4_PSEST|nr:hypothetical protein [Pseudonocardia sediminis]RZT86924.1 hypothetical protein EV383_3823 [Pseudonocardia sediminis]